MSLINIGGGGIAKGVIGLFFNLTCDNEDPRQGPGEIPIGLKN